MLTLVLFLTMAKRQFLPNGISRKLDKTKQTRGAEDDEIFQNRVCRNSTVLIYFRDYPTYKKLNKNFENGFIVLISPFDYFNNKSSVFKELKIGENMLVFYETRKDWCDYPIKDNWMPATSRTNPLGGEYVARVPANTALENNEKIFRGYTSTNLKGAGIRVYEYADSETLKKTRTQLEFIFWHCFDIEDFINKNENKESLREQKNRCIEETKNLNVDDIKLLQKSRILNTKGHTICPLCLKEMSAFTFDKKIVQSEGRYVPDTTVTEISLFHIKELCNGEFNHKTYNLGWGHHFCNVVVKDVGIYNTLKWMRQVLKDNDKLSKK